MLGPEDFLGRWSLQRTIEDRFLGQKGSFGGTATFQAQDTDWLGYHEEGLIKLGDGPLMSAERRYQWHFDEAGVDVRFADGAAFHRFKPKGIGAGTDHPCGDDFYTVQYDFSAWPAWSAVWTVSGPRKDYTSTSHYRPKASPVG